MASKSASATAAAKAIKSVPPVKPPEMRVLKISYGVGCRVNLGNYEHADAHISRSEDWDVSSFSPEETDEFWHVRRAELKQELDFLIEAEYREMSGEVKEENAR